jgi:predicted DNA-binding protein (MmcQ/YjbR family)
VAFEALEDLDAEEVRGWLAAAHALVAAKLTRKARAELGLAPPAV